VNALLMLILNEIGENSITIGRDCPIDDAVVLGVTANSWTAKLALKTNV